MREFLKKHNGISRFISFLYRGLNFNRFSLNRKNNNTLKCSNCYLKRCRVKIRGKNNHIVMRNLCQISFSSIEIYGDNNILEFGEKVYGKNVSVYMEDSNNKIVVGNNTIFAGSIHLALTEGKSITIGKKCLFSNSIVFRTGDSHSILSSDNKRINKGADIFVGNHVWVTEKATILKGSYICDDSVVACNSVVTKKIEESNVILAGVPARIVKRDINWDINRL